MHWLTVPQAAERLGLTEHTVRTLIRRGRLPASRFTRALLIRPEDVDQLLVDSQVTPEVP